MHLVDALEVGARFVETRVIEMIEAGRGDASGFLIGQGRGRQRCSRRRKNGNRE
jgi:hypothetical protein